MLAKSPQNNEDEGPWGDELSPDQYPGPSQIFRKVSPLCSMPSNFERACPVSGVAKTSETPLNPTSNSGSKSVLLARLARYAIASCFFIQGCGSPTPSEPKTEPNNKPSQAQNEAAKQTSQATTEPTRSTDPEDFQEGLAKASKLLSDKKTQEAWDAVKRLSLVRPQDPQLLYLTALVLAAKDDLPGAIQTIRRIPEDAPEAVPAAGQAAEWTVALGKLPEAEAELLKLIKQYPTAVPANRLLAKIYNAQGRRFEASRYLDRLIRLGDFTRIELLGTVDPRDYFDDETVRNAFAEAYPDHPYVSFAKIRTRLIRNGYETNLAELKQISSQNPQMVEPWVWTATSMLETDRLKELPSWLATRPNGADKHPEYWYALGGLLLRTDRDESAARCFVQAIQLDRRHVAAYQGLADALIELKLVDEAQRVREFGNDLVSVNDFAQQISYEYGDPILFDKIASIYQKLGDEVAAFGWEALAVTLGHRPMTDALKERQVALKKGPPGPPKVLDGLPWESWSLPADLPSDLPASIAKQDSAAQNDPQTAVSPWKMSPKN